MDSSTSDGSHPLTDIGVVVPPLLVRVVNIRTRAAGAGGIYGGGTPPRVWIGGPFAELLFHGKRLDICFNQINVRVPSGIVLRPVIAVRTNYLGRSTNQVSTGVK